MKTAQDKYGLFFTDIPREEVPYDFSELENLNMIENGFGQVLLYFKERRSYSFINCDPSSFISKDQMYSPWKKVNV